MEKMKGPIAIVTDPERRKYFEAIFGSNAVPVTTYLPVTVKVPEKGITEAYTLDFKRVTPTQRQAIIAHIAQRLKLDPTSVAKDLEKMGVPILADQCPVAIPASLVTPDDSPVDEAEEDEDDEDWGWEDSDDC